MAHTADKTEQEQGNFWGVLSAVLLLTSLAAFFPYLPQGAISSESVESESLPSASDVGVVDLGVPPSLAPGAIQLGKSSYIQVDDGVLKLYFTGSSEDLPHGADEVMLRMANSATQREKKIAVTSFYAAELGSTTNLRHAQRRSQAVQQALQALGFKASEVVVRRPVLVAPPGQRVDDASRRVEVLILED